MKQIKANEFLAYTRQKPFIKLNAAKSYQQKQWLIVNANKKYKKKTQAEAQLELIHNTRSLKLEKMQVALQGVF